MGNKTDMNKILFFLLNRNWFDHAAKVEKKCHRKKLRQYFFTTANPHFLYLSVSFFKSCLLTYVKNTRLILLYGRLRGQS